MIVLSSVVMSPSPLTSSQIALPYGERVERIGGDRRPFQFITFGELVAVFQIDLAVEKRIGVVGLRHDTDGVVTVERTDGIPLFGDVRTHGALRGGDDVVQTAHAHHLVAVDRDVGADVPVDLAGQHAGIDLKIETAVADLRRPQIGLGCSGARDRGDRIVVEDVRRDRIVIVADHVQAAAEKSEVDTDVGLRGGLPNRAQHRRTNLRRSSRRGCCRRRSCPSRSRRSRRSCRCRCYRSCLSSPADGSKRRVPAHPSRRVR